MIIDDVPGMLGFFLLQCVKLLFTESKKGSTLLYYIVGNRVLLYTRRAFDNERALNKLLRYIIPFTLCVPNLPPCTEQIYIHCCICVLCSVGLDEHEDAVVKMQKSSKAAAKVGRNQLREIAQLVSFKHLHTEPLDPVACIHREDGDVEFMNIVANELAAKVLCLHAFPIFVDIIDSFFPPSVTLCL